MDLKEARSGGVKNKARKRIGRGQGSGTGKTSGKGHKGQRARSGFSRKSGGEGGQMPLYRRVPKRGFNNARFRRDYTIINVDLLAQFDEGARVDMDAILHAGLISPSSPYLKVLGNGELSKKLTVVAHRFSASAKQKIEAAGGTAEVVA
ncbi:MAG: 50S ribosomal protein L15 [Planctomycetes bacterium]|nr:50S ribosomal protein L15 [Planctomycetota bacterium]